MADRRTRIAVVNNDKKCRQECRKSCSVVMTVINPLFFFFFLVNHHERKEDNALLWNGFLLLTINFTCETVEEITLFVILLMQGNYASRSLLPQKLHLFLRSCVLAAVNSSRYL